MVDHASAWVYEAREGTELPGVRLNLSISIPQTIRLVGFLNDIAAFTFWNVDLMRLPGVSQTV